tara:strand:- start:580 stop:954 length:375 start_codon:yes stop_codon:yes gene_type:complete
MKKYFTNYEWDMELAEDPWIMPDGDVCADILDHRHENHLRDLQELPSPQDGEHHRLVLVRDMGNEEEGVTCRQYAYLTQEGELPEYFGEAQGYKIPVRFHRELAANPWAKKFVEPTEIIGDESG